VTLSNALAVHALKEESVISISKQLADAMQAVHDAGWLHCDLKGNNILLDLADPQHHVRVVIIDFGQAVLKEKTLHYWHLPPHKLEETKKRVYWIPEEVLCCKQPYSCKSDVHAYGKVLSELYRVLDQSPCRVELKKLNLCCVADHWLRLGSFKEIVKTLSTLPLRNT
jgi:serine/threonine protein kinase